MCLLLIRYYQYQYVLMANDIYPPLLTDTIDEDEDKELEELQQDLQDYKIDEIVDIPIALKVSSIGTTKIQAASSDPKHTSHHASKHNKSRLMVARNRVMGHHD